MIGWRLYEDDRWLTLLLGMIILAASLYGIWLTWVACSGLWNGAPWYGTVYVGVKNGREFYWHIWFALPLGLALLSPGLAVFWAFISMMRRRK
jgi:hypothetical protein